MSTSPSTSSNPSDAGVQQYFERGSTRFDNIYDSGKKGAKEALIDRYFHGTIQKRFEMTLDELSPFDGKRMLDIGCGPGRYSVEFAVRGAREVVGVDFSQNMLALAEANAAERGVAERCRFVTGDFLTWQDAGGYDGTVSIGFIEYMRDPQAVINKLASLTAGTLIVSFPKLWTLRTFPRMIRYKYNRCYLRFFTSAELKQYAENAMPKFASYRIAETDRDYLLIAKTR